MGASRTRFLQVPQDRGSDACHQRVLLGAQLLWPRDMKDLAVPVQILQTYEVLPCPPQTACR